MVIILLLGFVFIVGPTIFIMETTITGFGNMLRDFSTWQRGWNHLVELKDVKKRISLKIGRFFWSWWLVYAPFIGLFIARISKGRRLKEVILGTIVYGTLDVCCSLVYLETTQYTYKFLNNSTLFNI